MFLFRRKSSSTKKDAIAATPLRSLNNNSWEPSLQEPHEISSSANGASCSTSGHDNYEKKTSSSIAAVVQERLAQEVLRKLRLAIVSEDKDARDIICNEVFADVTSELNSAARDSTGALYRRWYEALAPYFCRVQHSSEDVLSACNRLWGQACAAPIFALLLHQWLLVHPDAGGSEQRLKYINILISGSRQLFLGDVESDTMAFRPVHAFMLEQVVLFSSGLRLNTLPPPGREALVSLVAAFAPYYLLAKELPGLAVELGPDLLVDCIVDVMAAELRAESAVLRYVRALVALQNTPALSLLRTSTRIRLQGELYALMQPGGPRYASRKVNKEAFAALDTLFPHGRRTRRMINLAFRFLHPQEWPWVWWDATWAVGAGLMTWMGRALRPLMMPFTSLSRVRSVRRAEEQ